MRELTTQSHRTLLCVFPNSNTKSLQIWDGMDIGRVLECFPWGEGVQFAGKMGENRRESVENPRVARVAGWRPIFVLLPPLLALSPFLLSLPLVGRFTLSLLPNRSSSPQSVKFYFQVGQLCPTRSLLRLFSTNLAHTHIINKIQIKNNIIVSKTPKLQMLITSSL